MAKPLQDDGFAVGHSNARRLMRQAKVTVEWLTKRGPVSTDSRPSEAMAPKSLARQFDVAQPDQVWGGDSPSIWTTEGWLYLAG